MLDPKQDVILKVDVIDTNRNWYSKGSRFVPGALPVKFLTEQYCTNVPKVEASLIAGEQTSENITLETASDKLSKPIEYDQVLINSATIDEMIKVEGVSTAAASKIVANRESNGAFESVKNLIERLPALAKFETLLNERFNFEKNGWVRVATDRTLSDE